MKNFILLSILIFVGCRSSNTSNSFISFGKNKIYIELADTHKKREVGLMNRAHLKKNNGMLFVFDKQQTLSFWMKNTLIPLSIGYIDNTCKLIDVQQMFPYKKNTSNYKTYTSLGPALYALETNIGWFKKNNIKVGDKISSQSKNLNICALKK